MENLNRREVLVALSALAAVGAGALEAQEAAAADKPLPESGSWTFDSLKANASPDGHVTRPVIRGVTATGEAVEVHETMLPAGQMPHPPHKHRHSEFLFIRDGDLEFTSGGKTSRIGPGSVAFNGSNVMHGLKNVGTTPANYFVIEIGRREG